MHKIRRQLLITVLILLGVGLVMVYSASAVYADQKLGQSAYFLKRHILHCLAGLIGMAGVMSIPRSKLKQLGRPALLAAIFMLVLVLVPGIGRQISGARRWFRIAGVSFQPVEFAKLALIIYLADVISRKQTQVNKLFYCFLPAVLVIGLVMGLVVLQPDLGTSMLIGMVGLLLLCVAGVPLKYLGLLILSSLPAVYVLIFKVEYRRRRIMAFLNPWADRKATGFQLVQSLLALGSGGLFGLGLGQSRQKLFYLPEAHTDFIFSIIGEELGLIGTGGVIVLFGIFIWLGMRLALKSEDLFGHLVCVGLVSMVALEAVINIGVSCGGLPTKGLPLPFISYGGSSLFFHLVGVGLLFNVSRSSE